MPVRPQSVPDQTDGFYENNFTGENDAVDYLADKTVHGRLIWEPSEDLKFDLRGKYSEVQGGAINFNAVFAIPKFVNPAILGPNAWADVNDHKFNFVFNVPGENDQETTVLSLKADWALGWAYMTTHVTDRGRRPAAALAGACPRTVTSCTCPTVETQMRALITLLLTFVAWQATAQGHAPDPVRVGFETYMGTFTVALYAEHAENIRGATGIIECTWRGGSNSVEFAYTAPVTHQDRRHCTSYIAKLLNALVQARSSWVPCRGQWCRILPEYQPG